MRSYQRLDPRMVEKKLAAGYTLAQIGAYVMLLNQAEQQPERGRFKSLGVLKAAMDCMVEELGPRARTSQLLPFLLDQHDVTKLEGGGYYVEGWDEWQEGDHTPRDRMDLVRSRRGRPGDPLSPGARRQRRYRAKQAPEEAEPAADVTSQINANSDVTSQIPSDVSHGEINCDERHVARDLDVSSSGKRLAVSSSGRDASPSGDGDAADVTAANGLSTERTDVRAYGERLIHHGRTPSGDDIEFLRRVPYEFGRLAESVVLGAIDDVAGRFLAQGKPMPQAKYLAGKLGDLQAAAADAGVRPDANRGQGRGLVRLGDLLPRTGTP